MFRKIFKPLIKLSQIYSPTFQTACFLIVSETLGFRVTIRPSKKTSFISGILNADEQKTVVLYHRVITQLLSQSLVKKLSYSLLDAI